MSDESPAGFAALMERVRAGCPAATRRLVDLFTPVLRRLVSRRLSARLRPLFDSRDFTQDTWAAFFAGPVHKQTFAAPERLRSYLSRVARNLVFNANHRHVDCQKYDRRRECPLDSPDVCPERTWSRITRHPTRLGALATSATGCAGAGAPSTGA
jgi:DNA-directed RNA polymerase specialized sigma24 family protein